MGTTGIATPRGMITDAALAANYLRGHRDGYLDRQHNRRSAASLMSAVPGYATGYYDGWEGHAPDPGLCGGTGTQATS